MAPYYFDSSGIVKYYILEKGSSWVSQLVSAQTTAGEWANEIVIARIGIVEVGAAIAKRQRMGEISQRLQEKTLAQFSKELRQRYTVVPATDKTIELALTLTQRQPLRAYDAVQLATALVLNRTFLAHRLPTLTFVSADDTLCAAAQAEGLLAENPNEH
ncbi:MAG: type II toxin-antitoxin system VapC family toxin [Chloroflexi bacterium]|nr:type II toxin-antitoxin system VapC family toxin [Chloroflexota bacterium]